MFSVQKLYFVTEVECGVTKTMVKKNSHLIIAAVGEDLGAEPEFELMWWSYKCDNITEAHLTLENTCALQH